MQQYHMTHILLLVNKPHETTMRRSTVTSRLKSYRLIEEEVIFHCYEIWYVARIHTSTNPLHLKTQPVVSPYPVPKLPYGSIKHSLCS